MSYRLTVEQYSHGCRIRNYDREVFKHIEAFLEGLKLKDYSQDRFGRSILEIKKKFFLVTEDQTETFIHRHHLPEFLRWMAGRSYPSGVINLVHMSVPEAVPAEFILKEGWSARDYQVPIVDKLLGDHHSLALKLQTGKGKEQSLDSWIKIPGGWDTMGNMRVGTEVIAPDGTTTKVTGVYPQGVKQMYRVTFRDGRSTECGAEHLWRVYYVNTSVNKRWRVVDTLEMLRLNSMPNPRVYVQLIESEQSPDIDLPLPPYTLGALLGDGGLSGASINLTKADPELFDRVESEFPPNLSFVVADDITRRIVSTDRRNHPYREALKELGLMGTRSWEKHIPEIYLRGSHTQREALLQGLMDTDGTVGTTESGGSTNFCSTSLALAEGVQYLVRSLGGMASIRPRQTHYMHLGEKKAGRPSFIVDIRHPRPSTLFSIPRKKERTNDNNQYAADLKLRVVSIVPTRMAEAQCISVEHPDHLYITDDFIVTHNTATSLLAVSEIKERLAIMIPPKYFGIWDEALEELFPSMGMRVVKIKGSDQLKAVIQAALNGKLDIDAIMISAPTYRAYIETYERFGEAGSKALGYGVPPYEFHKTLGIGVQINDEIQDDPGLVFRTDIMTNVRKQIYLSATPFTGSDFVTQMIDVMLPEHTDCPLPELDVYVDVVAVIYSDPSIKPKDVSRYKGNYSHSAYEDAITKKPERQKAYFNMVRKLVHTLYGRDKLPKQKLLILCSTVEFIEKLRKFLVTAFPDLKINGHVSGSPYSALLASDVTISTPKSAGTGVDIPDLREVLMLLCTDSRKDNLQIIGRLRRMKNFPTVTPRLTYVACRNVQQQMKYHNNKHDIFDKRVLTHKVFQFTN